MFFSKTQFVILTSVALTNIPPAAPSRYPLVNFRLLKTDPAPSEVIEIILVNPFPSKVAMESALNVKFLLTLM